MPIALEPPPTQAQTASGSRPSSASTCSRASSPMPRVKSRTIAGNGCGAGGGPQQVVGVVDVATQSRSASLMASLSVRLPVATGTTSAPSIRIRATLSAWRSMSTSPM